jgi:hypothetical protein
MLVTGCPSPAAKQLAVLPLLLLAKKLLLLLPLLHLPLLMQQPPAHSGVVSGATAGHAAG